VDNVKVKVEEGAEEPPAAATAGDVPYPLSLRETQDGWDTLMNKCWLQCADCKRWRNVPEEVRDKVRVAFACMLRRLLPRSWYTDAMWGGRQCTFYSTTQS